MSDKSIDDYVKEIKKTNYDRTQELKNKVVSKKESPEEILIRMERLMKEMLSIIREDKQK